MTNKLKVYAYSQPDGARQLVAFSSKSGAAALLGVTTYLLATHGEVSQQADEVAVALSDPGAVWERQPGGESWSVVSDAGKAQLIPRHGGKRAGAGQPRLAPKVSRPRSISLDDDTHAAFMALGGSKYLRRVIAANLNLTNKEWDELARRGGVRWLKELLSDKCDFPYSLGAAK